MADNVPAPQQYTLSPTEATAWRGNVIDMMLLHQQLAEVHRQGGFGLEPQVNILYPDGTHALRLSFDQPSTQEPPVPQSAQASVAPQAPAIERAQTRTADLGRAEGTLIETATITAYRMSANESAAWSRGDHEARMVEANIGDALKDVGTTQPVTVLLDDGRAMYTHGSSLAQDLGAALGLLRDRLSALTSGVQVHLDFSVQFGKPQTTTQTTVEALQERAAQLTHHAPQRSREQGISY
jgi:hypothetical protein